MCLIRKQIIDQISDIEDIDDTISYSVLLKCIQKSDKIFHIQSLLFSVLNYASEHNIESKKILLQAHFKRTRYRCKNP